MPLLQYAAASSHSILLIPALVLYATVMLYILKNGWPLMVLRQKAGIDCNEWATPPQAVEVSMQDTINFYAPNGGVLDPSFAI